MMNADELNGMLAEHWPQAPVRCLDVSRTSAIAAYNISDVDIRPGGYVSGPAQFAVADCALWFVVCGALGRAEPMALTSELSIRFLRPAQAQELRARAHLERASGRSTVASVRVWAHPNEGEPCAVAQGTYVLPKP
jgi:uncharacterized protein (TIGR00369 family)